MKAETHNIKKADIHEIKCVAESLAEIRKEVARVFFGHQDVTDSMLRALLCKGHILLEGVPGIAKTLAIKALAEVSGCSSKRIQFTVDLLPSDIVGLTIYEPKKGFEVIKGPVFANFVIADEINRSPPKTQSALIEAMQEERVTIGKQTFDLPKPFFVMATQNPIESEGVYTLPEAQVDRFLFKIKLGYPKEEDELRIMEENITFNKFEDINLKPIVSASKIIHMQKLVHRIYLDPKIKEYILNIVKKTRDKNFKLGEYIELGASPRASISLFIASKAEAIMQGRNFVIPQDVEVVAHDSMRHRIFLSYKAQADGITSDDIISDILKSVNSP